MAPVQGQFVCILTSFPDCKALKASLWILWMTVRVSSSAGDWGSLSGMSAGQK